MRWNEHKTSKKHPRRYRLSLEKRLPDFNNFRYEYVGHNWPLNDRSSSHLTQRLLWASKICVEMNKKTSINFISPDLWPQQPVNYMVWLSWSSESIRWRLGMLMNSRSDWWSLHGSGAEHYRHCYEWMEKTSPCLCSRNGPTFRTFYCRQLKRG